MTEPIVTCPCCGMPRTMNTCHYCALFGSQTEMGPGPILEKGTAR